MDLPIVVGVDGSEPSLRAVDRAAYEAALRGVPLRLVYARLWERYEGSSLAQDLARPSGQVTAEDVIETAANRARLREPGVRLSIAVLPEEPEYTLVRESRTASAVVLGSRGRSAMTEALLGSVSVTVAGHAHCPVIVLRGSHDDQARSGRHGRVAVGVGEKPAHSAAVRFALDEARLRHVPLDAVRAWRAPAHETTDHPLMSGGAARLHEERAAEELEEAFREAPDDVEVRRRIVEGHARRVLLDASAGADLLVVGARRRSGHFGLQLGRVAHGVLHHAACPVAVVPEEA
ncbi:universal stress protein [Streptomyces brasiliensis]|uniref:Universal stress protein n=1 Tax=Streptomyces brasiliensis TaxID=1954 RepID=A0A917KBP4_9ACTN|nr:universal stress protein [Streptomyces brasiliensis]GGJ06697.1 universal stress protein [Streptomyces brasiliensis]